MKIIEDIADKQTNKEFLLNVQKELHVIYVEYKFLIKRKGIWVDDLPEAIKKLNINIKTSKRRHQYQHEENQTII